VSGNNHKVKEHWDRAGLGQAIFDALEAAGVALDHLTLDDMAPLDQFHGGGKTFTTRLARLADLKPGTRVLDVGGGLGGPARTLAVEFGCMITSLDLTESYIQASEMITRQMGLNKRVSHRLGNALDLLFEDGKFDVVWTQNSGMNIADKERLYAGFHRVLRPGGLLVTQEPMAGPVQPVIFPVMWARDGASSFLRTPEEMRRVIEAAGFRTLKWDDVTLERTPSDSARPAYSIQQLVMGEDLLAEIASAGRRNQEERRLVMAQAVFERA
jgi:SAM-dependent methyltransferase